MTAGKITYLELDDVLIIQEDLIRRYGGAVGVRDKGQIEAALFRPQTGYYKDITQQAAALWESLSQNHGFLDGNKRTAFACTDIFLKINGTLITTHPDDIFPFINHLHTTQSFTLESLEPWLRANTKKI